MLFAPQVLQEQGMQPVFVKVQIKVDERADTLYFLHKRRIKRQFRQEFKVPVFDKGQFYEIAPEIFGYNPKDFVGYEVKDIYFHGRAGVVRIGRAVFKGEAGQVDSESPSLSITVHRV